ncbi:MAG TPA: hypothetical protein ENJ29_11945 [Bacteroidetes bacterium]|nr:hypothetical protein [Bacteroidota bacterium]
MQSYVNKITAAATATGLFQLVDDAIFDENEKYPALIVGDRTAQCDGIEIANRVYNEAWVYEVFVMTKKANGWTDLENLSSSFLKELLNGEFRLISQHHSEVLISGRDVLVNSMRIEALARGAYV